MGTKFRDAQSQALLVGACFLTGGQYNYRADGNNVLLPELVNLHAVKGISVGASVR
jgi:hypothetical protein